MKMRCQARPRGIAARCQFLSGGWTNRAARCLVSFACVWLSVGVLPSAAGQGSQETSGEQETPAATVGDETLYEKDFLPQIQAELYRIRREEYELKRRALESEINKQLLQAEARERGISVPCGDGRNPSPSGEEKSVVVWSRATVSPWSAHEN